MDAFFVFVFLGLLATGFIGLSLARQRAIRSYAMARGFVFIGIALPATLKLPTKSFSAAHRVRNAFAGERARCDFVFFDCTIGKNKYAYGRSVLAVRSHSSDREIKGIPPEFEREDAGEWALFFQERRQLEVPEIDDIISAL